jgi:tRNA pseudouridine(38-40) synthase
VFRVPATSDPKAAGAALRELLPADIQLIAASWAPARFHPRWSAQGKEYVYRLSTLPEKWSWEALQAGAAELACCPALDGFTGPGAPERAAPPLEALVIERTAEEVLLRFRGPAFRRYAIRNMVGCLWQQAQGELLPGSCSAGAAAAPPWRGVRAPADGLTLMKVFYPPELDPFREP